MATLKDKAIGLQFRSPHSMSLSTIDRRMRNGWSDEKIINTPVQLKPPKSHPLKQQSYKYMSERKRWECVVNGVRYRPGRSDGGFSEFYDSLRAQWRISRFLNSELDFISKDQLQSGKK